MKKKAYCFISNNHTGQVAALRGLLEKKNATVGILKPIYYVLHIEKGNRIFPIDKRSVEVYYLNPDDTVDFNRQPDIVIEDPYDYEKNIPVHPYHPDAH